MCGKVKRKKGKKVDKLRLKLKSYKFEMGSEEQYTGSICAIHLCFIVIFHVFYLDEFYALI